MQSGMEGTAHPGMVCTPQANARNCSSISWLGQDRAGDYLNFRIGDLKKICHTVMNETFRNALKCVLVMQKKPLVLIGYLMYRAFCQCCCAKEICSLRSFILSSSQKFLGKLDIFEINKRFSSW